MIELYLGKGKGKTTAAAGLAIRAAGHGIPVIFAQFLKDGSSGEVLSMKHIPEITYLRTEHFFGFMKNMSPEQRQTVKKENEEQLKKISELIRSVTEHSGKKTAESDIILLVVLDELLTAVDGGLLSSDSLELFLDQVPGSAEIILTGRSAAGRIISRADYISEISPAKHPYEKGISARRGVEY